MQIMISTYFFVQNDNLYTTYIKNNKKLQRISAADAMISGYIHPEMIVT